MTHTEALTMAYHYIDNVDYGPYDSKPVLDAIKEALAQPQQEPVAWMDREGDLYKMPEIKNWAPPHTMLYTTPPQQQAEPTPWRDMVVVSLVREGIDKHRARELADHFAAQQQAEPVACRFCHSERGCWTWQCYHCGEIDDVQKPTQSAPPQRPWVGLTPEEILDLFDRNNVYGSKWIEFVRTVEAKLKEKNDH